MKGQLGRHELLPHVPKVQHGCLFHRRYDHLHAPEGLADAWVPDADDREDEAAANRKDKHANFYKRQHILGSIRHDIATFPLNEIKTSFNSCVAPQVPDYLHQGKGDECKIGPKIENLLEFLPHLFVRFSGQFPAPEPFCRAQLINDYGPSLPC